jgi:hypothetical protein
MDKVAQCDALIDHPDFEGTRKPGMNHVGDKENCKGHSRRRNYNEEPEYKASKDSSMITFAEHSFAETSPTTNPSNRVRQPRWIPESEIQKKCNGNGPDP